jgi:hypothetical protein
MINANAFIASGVALLALAAGVFLLAKATRDNLGPIYKIVAWFIIIASIVNAGFNAMNCMFKFYHKHMMMGHEMRMDHEMKMNKMFMHYKMWPNSGTCRESCEGQCCREDAMDCGGMCRPGNQDNCKKCCEGSRDSSNRESNKMNK